MRIIGLTGSIGMGKSTAAQLLRGMHVPVHDADAAVHAALAPGGAGVAAVRALYPAAHRAADGGIDRKVLGQAAFHDAALMAKLEAILHPLVRAAEQTFLAQARTAQARLVVLDIPLLFETGAQQRVDAVWVVSAPADVQRRRVLARPGMTPEKFAAILAKQVSDAEKRARAARVIPTGYGKLVTWAALWWAVRTAHG